MANKKTIKEIKNLIKSLSNKEKLKLFKEIPIWIGAEIWVHDSTVRVCIGLNMEDGNEVSYCSGADIEEAEKNNQDVWVFNGKVNLKVGKNARIFDDNHNLIL